jgi:hypothetical protein
MGSRHSIRTTMHDDKRARDRHERFLRRATADLPERALEGTAKQAGAEPDEHPEKPCHHDEPPTTYQTVPAGAGDARTRPCLAHDPGCIRDGLRLDSSFGTGDPGSEVSEREYDESARPTERTPARGRDQVD